MCTVRLFSQGVDLIALKFYLNMVVPHLPFLASENYRDAGLPDAEDRILLFSLVLTQYPNLSNRQTERRICRNIYSACKANYAARCKNYS